MTKEEKMKLYKRYTSKCLLVGVEPPFIVDPYRGIVIGLVEFAKIRGFPEKLVIPDFVDSIV